MVGRAPEDVCRGPELGAEFTWKVFGYGRCTLAYGLAVGVPATHSESMRTSDRQRIEFAVNRHHQIAYPNAIECNDKYRINDHKIVSLCSKHLPSTKPSFKAVCTGFGLRFKDLSLRHNRLSWRCKLAARLFIAQHSKWMYQVLLSPFLMHKSLNTVFPRPDTRFSSLFEENLTLLFHQHPSENDMCHRCWSCWPCGTENGAW